MPDSLFSRSNQESGSDDPAEGVRIIKPEDAAEAVERGDAVKRKEQGLPKYGDRPEQPSTDVRPALRFPLSDRADASAIERPRVAPVEPRSADDGPLEPPAGDEPAAEPVSAEPPRTEPRPAPPASAEPPDLEADRPRIVAREDLGLPVDEPVIRVEPATGETEMLPWTAPATGEVPKVVIGDVDEDDPEQARWSSYAASGPRWRDQDEDWGDSGDLADLTDAAEDDVPLGALDTGERPSQEEFLGFDDLEVPEPPPAATGRTPAAGSDPSGPIRIKSGGRPAPPAASSPTGAATEPAAEPPRRRTPAREAAAAAGAGARRSRPPADEPPSGGGGGAGAPRDVPQAVFVGIAIAAVAIILFKIGPAAAMILVEAVVVLAAIEFFSAVRRGGHRPATLLGLAAVAAFPLAVYWRGEGAIPVVLFLTVVFTMLWYLLGVGGPARAVPNIGVTLFGVLYIGLLGAFAALILDIPVQGVSILLVAAFAGVGYDVGGFFIGQRMGKTPLTDISPGKTVEGLAGGMIASLVAVLIVSRFFGPFDSFGKALVFGVCLAIAAPFGDLCESLLKRDLGLKDMGSILPGHGGVLDRFDGMLFVLPAAYYLVRVLGLVPGF